jgi:hypothetical protein
MTEIGLIMLFIALWGAPAAPGQADFKIDFSGEQHRDIRCQGSVAFDKQSGHEAMRVRQTCQGAGAQDENREVILRFDQHKLYMLNHALKRYDVEDLATMPEVFKSILKDYDGKPQTQPFLEGTQLWLQPTGREFWIMGVQDPSQQQRFSEIHLIAPGYGGHMYLSYGTASVKDDFEPPKDYKPAE